jgi:hypothetical protein
MLLDLLIALLTPGTGPASGSLTLAAALLPTTTLTLSAAIM